MSWSLPPDDILNESGHTDNAGDQSNESDGGVMFNASEYRLNAHAADYYLLQDTNTSFGEICHLYNAERTPSSPAYSPSKQEFESPNQQYRYVNYITILRLSF